jgi:hypothetical protein
MNSCFDSRWYCGLKNGLVLVSLALVSMWSLASTPELPKKAAKKAPSASRVEAKSKATQMATGIQAAEAALTPAELAIAQQVEVGQMACELGVSVSVNADAKLPGYFDVQSKKLKFRMVPVVTSTGAIRLEDPRAGAVWLQLANKSMLMNQKLGARLADACMSPSQIAVAAAMEKNPPPSLLEPLPAAVKPVSLTEEPIVSSSIAIQ